MKKNVIATISMILVSAVLVFAQENKTIENFKGEVINGVIINGAFDIQLSEGVETGGDDSDPGGCGWQTQDLDNRK